MNVHFNHQKSRRAFSLVELLVVIGIFAVLAAIVFPVVNVASEKGKATASVNNLRQWGLALHSYLADTGQSNAKMPYEGLEAQPNWNQTKTTANELAWYNVLPPYVQEKPIREFTAADQTLMWQGKTMHRDPAAKVVSNVIGNRPPFSYMMNSQLRDDGQIPIVQVEKPSLTVFMTETRTSIKDRVPGTTTSSDLARAKGRNNRVSGRHNDKTHILFMDGRVAAFDALYVYNNNRDPASPGGDNLKDIKWNSITVE